jgi:hypothetical protein
VLCIALLGKLSIFTVQIISDSDTFSSGNHRQLRLAIYGDINAGLPPTLVECTDTLTHVETLNYLPVMPPTPYHVINVQPIWHCYQHENYFIYTTLYYYTLQVEAGG